MTDGRAHRWKLVYSNGDEETIDQLLKLRMSPDGQRMTLETPSNIHSEVVRTFNMRHVRSWEAVQ